jgi:drug/metabolite transporter (DMT)-like permease
VTRYWPLLFVLAAIWGASYLFIKVALEDIEPAPMMASRALVAGLVLAAYLSATLGTRRALRELRASWRAALVLGTLNAAIPFWLIAWGEKHIDSSVAGIAQSTVPIFTFLLATRFLPHERVGPARVTGVALGFLGVAVLAGFDPRGGWLAVAGTLAVVLSSLMYASAGVYGQLRVRTVAGPVLATGSMLVGGLILVPLSLFQLPTSPPDAATIASLLALTLLGTAFAQLVLFRMLRLFGSRRLSLVTYLIPGFAVVYGALLLDEPVSAAALGGLVLILAGVTLASGERLMRARSARRDDLPAQEEAA